MFIILGDVGLFNFRELQFIVNSSYIGPIASKPALSSVDDQPPNCVKPTKLVGFTQLLNQ